MRHFFSFVCSMFFFISCEKPSDCIESSGDTVLKIVPVLAFSKIKVYRGIQVFITQGPVYKVEIKAGSNFIDNIEVRQNGDQLILTDDVSCNWVRNYGETKIYITTPTLEEIYSKTDRSISSIGLLSFPNLNIISFDKDADGESGAGTGDFYLELDSNSITINNNNVSCFFLKGTTNEANFNFYYGDGRLDAANLIAQQVKVYHRGFNDMIVNPIQSVTGILNSTGNLILKNVPPIVTPLQVLYTGHVIYP